MKSVSLWLTPVALQPTIRRLPSAVCHIIAILKKNWTHFWHHCSVCVSCHHGRLIHIFSVRQLCFSGLYLSLCKWSVQSLKESCLKHLPIQVLLPPPMQWMFTANLAQNYFHAKKSCLQKLAKKCCRASGRRRAPQTNFGSKGETPSTNLGASDLELCQLSVHGCWEILRVMCSCTKWHKKINLKKCWF